MCQTILDFTMLQSPDAVNLNNHVAHSNNLKKIFSKAFKAGCKDKGPKLLTDISQTDNSCYSFVIRSWDEN